MPVGQVLELLFASVIELEFSDDLCFFVSCTSSAACFIALFDPTIDHKIAYNDLEVILTCILMQG